MNDDKLREIQRVTRGLVRAYAKECEELARIGEASVILAKVEEIKKNGDRLSRPVAPQ